MSGLELKDGMIISGEDGDRLLVKRLAHKAVRDRRLIETPHDQVDFTRRQQGQQFLGPAFHQTDIKIVVFDLQPASARRAGCRPPPRQRAERHDAAAGARQPVQILIQPVEFGQDASCRLDDAATGRRGMPRACRSNSRMSRMVSSSWRLLVRRAG